MKRYLIVQMGEEYYLAKEYAKALELVSHVTWEYRNERWPTLLHAILKITWRSAFLVGYDLRDEEEEEEEEEEDESKTLA